MCESHCLETFDELVESVKYKPGWEFRFYRAGLILQIMMPVKLSAPSTKTVEIPSNKVMKIYFNLPCGNDLYDMNRPQMIDRIFTLLMVAEQHEVKEFFLIGGAKYFDPHRLECHRVDGDLKMIHTPSHSLMGKAEA